MAMLRSDIIYECDECFAEVQICDGCGVTFISDDVDHEIICKDEKHYHEYCIDSEESA